jgi:uncharacterized protein (DUF3084 family)
MERLAQSVFAQTFRAYLTSPDDPQAQQEIIRAIPKRSRWFLCEVDGQDYAIRVLPTDRIELMHSIFSRPLTRLSPRTVRTQVEALALPLFPGG